MKVMTTGKRRALGAGRGRELQELALTIDALRVAEGEAQIQRNSAIVESFNQGLGPTYIGDSAGVDRTWVYTLAKTHPGDLYKWRREHPDPVEVLESARARINVLIRRIRLAYRETEEVPTAESQAELQ
jgi:hypothetical protein